MSTWKRVNLRVNIFSASQLLIDDQPVLQHRRIHNTNCNCAIVYCHNLFLTPLLLVP